MSRPLRSNHLQIIFKISKFCNLRCAYCYEFAYLADKARMPVAMIETAFRKLADYQFDKTSPGAGANGFAFVWHGGEPLLVPTSLYEEIGAIQAEVLKGRPYQNAIQTNLTVMPDRLVRWLRDGTFIDPDGIGFSFDVYGDQRVDTRGRRTTERVLGNLQKLLDNGIRTGGIAVLNRETAGQIENVFRFFDDLKLDFRLLPYHLEGFAEQTEAFGLTSHEIAAALNRLFDLWAASAANISIQPLAEYLEDAIRYIKGRKTAFYDKAVDEVAFIINTNGDVYSVIETYQEQYCYGNIVNQSFEEILDGPARRRLVAESRDRIARHCSRCEFYGACSGSPVADATPLEAGWLESDGCYVARVLAHMVERLSTRDLGLAGDPLPAVPPRAAAAILQHDPVHLSGSLI